MTSLELAQKAISILDKKKAIQLKLIKISDISSLADYFVLATGTGNTHVKALADDLEFQMKHTDGVEPNHIEGYRSNAWILMDYTEVIIHIFTGESRTFYDLDRLWQDGEEVDISTWIQPGE